MRIYSIGKNNTSYQRLNSNKVNINRKYALKYDSVTFNRLFRNEEFENFIAAY